MSSDLPELTQIGHYLIKGLLRHGTSADSYFAENASMRSQKVLLRVLLPETASDPAFVRSFMEEARIAARLDHNCIASVLDLKDDGERIYAVLEFIEGLELNELLERFEGWVEDTAKMLAGCPCAVGCPSCVQSPKCGNLNDYLDKEGALTLLRRLLASG